MSSAQRTELHSMVGQREKGNCELHFSQHMNWFEGVMNILRYGNHVYFRLMQFGIAPYHFEWRS